MKTRILTCLLPIVLLMGGNSSHAQSLNTDKTVEESSQKQFFDRFTWADNQRTDLHEFNFVGGYSFHSTRGFWGKIPDARLSVFTLRYNRKLFVFDERHLLEYVTELIISASYTVSETHQYKSGSFSGHGITPLGFQFNFNQNKIVQPFFKTSTGYMYFTERFPDERGVRFNFTLELGTGVEFVITKNVSLSVGYKYHHMSNGQIGQINPGVDSNIFYSGITIF